MSIFRKLMFNFWYLRKPPWDSGISPPELMDFIANHPAGRALDLGCGTGTNVITLAQHGWQVEGVDFAPRAIRLAKRKTAQVKLTPILKVGDVTRLDDVHGPFDLILDMGCYHSLPAAGKAAYRQNIARLLAPGGTFLLYLFFKESSDAPGPGVVEADLKAFSPPLTLISRTNSHDPNRRRSAWLNFTL